MCLTYMLLAQPLQIGNMARGAACDVTAGYTQPLPYYIASAEFPREFASLSVAIRNWDGGGAAPYIDYKTERIEGRVGGGRREDAELRHGAQKRDVKEAKTFAGGSQQEEKCRFSRSSLLLPAARKEYAALRCGSRCTPRPLRAQAARDGDAAGSCAAHCIHLTNAPRML
jgi:hypothetical protein